MTENQPTNNGEKTEETLPPILRDEKGRIVAGSGPLNPEGKLPGTKHLTTLLNEAIRKVAEGSDESYDKLLVKRVLKKAIVDGDMRAVEHVWDRMEGKPSQPITGPDNQPLFPSDMDRQAQINAALLNLGLGEQKNEPKPESTPNTPQ